MTFPQGSGVRLKIRRRRKTQCGHRRSEWEPQHPTTDGQNPQTNGPGKLPWSGQKFPWSPDSIPC